MKMNMNMLPSMVAFRGDLTIFSVLDIIQLVHSSQKTGRLRILSAERWEIGEVIFNHGRIVGARSGEVDNEGAVNKLLRVRTGSFEFLPSLKAFQVQIYLSTPNLLIRCLKQMDEEVAALV